MRRKHSILLLVGLLLLLVVGTAGAQEGGAVEGAQAPETGIEPTPLPTPEGESALETNQNEGSTGEGIDTEPGLPGAAFPVDALIVNGTTGTVLPGSPCPDPVHSAVYTTVQKAVTCAPDVAPPNSRTIGIEAGTYTENVTIAKNLKLEGVSATTAIVNGGDTGRVFTISPGYTVTFTALTLTNGTAANGGGLYTDGSTVTLIDSTVSANTATGDGGGIFTLGGTVTVLRSTLTGNTAASEGGGIYTSGGTIALGNSTLTGNSATTAGGAVYSSAGTVGLANATVASNSAPAGSNLFGSSANLITANSIIANGTGGANCAGTVISGGYNVSNDASCSLTQASDKPGVNPLLGTLASNGGGTQTMALQPGSPAINAGNNTICAAPPISNLDQRGTVRPQGAACDSGAFELAGAAPVNLIDNGDFSQPGTPPNTPPPGWSIYGLPSNPIWSVTGGVFNFHRVAGSMQGVIFQNTNESVVADGVLEAQFDLGNSSVNRKRALVLIHDGDFTDSAACTFWLPPNSPMQTYRMKLRATEAWTNATISIYASNPVDGVPAMQLDNVSLRPLPGEQFKGTLCTDPRTPNPPGGANGANLLENSDFSQPLNPTSAVNAWAALGNINVQLVSQVAQMYRSGSPRGNLIQEDPSLLPTGMPLEATFQMGNSHTARMRVVILIHKRDFGDLGVCTFWLAPNTPLQAFTMRTQTTIAWNDATTISFYAADPTFSGAAPTGRVLLDNVTLRQRPALDVVGTECYEPGQTVPADEAFQQLIAPTLEPTATPGLPGGELPIVATPVGVAPAEAGFPSEGSAGGETTGGG
jgi:hypothetical protein